MEEIFFKIKVSKSDKTLEDIKNERLLFETIANALDIDRSSIIEVDESN